MPYAKIHAGREYLARWAPVAGSFAGAGVDGAWLREAAANGVRQLGLEPLEAWSERDYVVVRARGVRNGAPWVPIAWGGLELVHLVETGDAGDARRSSTGADPLPVAANLRRGGTYLFRFHAPETKATDAERMALAGDAAMKLGFELVASEGRMPSGLVGVVVRAKRDESLELPLTVAHVPDWGWTGGPPGSKGAQVAEAYPERLRLVRVEPIPLAPPVTTGQAPMAPAAAVCTLVQPAGSAYAVKTSVRYRALVSVSKHFDKAAIAKYLGEHGWVSVALYEPGEALPADWPAEPSLAELGALEENHRWLRGDATRTGEDMSLDVVSTLHKLISLRLSIYRVAALWSCTPRAPARAPVPAPMPAPAASSPSSPSSSSSAAAPLVIVYGARWCQACASATSWLTAQRIPFVEKDVDEDPGARAELARKLAAAKLSDPGVLPMLDVAGRMLAGFSPDVVQAALGAAGAPVALLTMGPGSGPGGLDATISADHARSVQAAWAFEPDAGRLRQFAATLRQAGYPIAAGVLDQRALTVQAESQEAQRGRDAKERAKKTDKALQVAGIVVGVAGIVIAVARR
jgi:Glutaredoxin